MATSASTDTAAPTVNVTAPANGATVNTGQTVNITGTASDAGGVVGAVEVSTDGGATWHPANGTTSWSYQWVPKTLGSASILARAVDDSANIGGAVTRNVTVSFQCPCTLFSASATPVTPAANDSSAVELGMRFTPDRDGLITGVRFYKGTGNSGTHTGSLWTTAGQQLATVTFTNETATGWQQALFSTPVAVNAATTYIVSYFAPNGRYAADGAFFASAGYTNAPLSAPQSTATAGNGVYRGGSTGFPGDTYGSSNYWVDVVFTLNLAPPDGRLAQPRHGRLERPARDQRVGDLHQVHAARHDPVLAAGRRAARPSPATAPTRRPRAPTPSTPAPTWCPGRPTRPRCRRAPTPAASP